MENYKVYLHVFPDGKKYVGCTKMSLRARWQGGLGYKDQDRVFVAILKYGWESIKHYLLFDGLSKRDAELIESALIRKWKTYKLTYGYNGVVPNIDGADTYVVPKYKRTQIEDGYEEPIKDRYMRSINRCKTNPGSGSKRVRLVETGEVFNSATHAALNMCVSSRAISYAANKPNRTCGTCDVYDPEVGWIRYVRAHWEYID